MSVQIRVFKGDTPAPPPVSSIAHTFFPLATTNSSVNASAGASRASTLNISSLQGAEYGWVSTVSKSKLLQYITGTVEEHSNPGHSALLLVPPGVDWHRGLHTSVFPKISQSGREVPRIQELVTDIAAEKTPPRVHSLPVRSIDAALEFVEYIRTEAHHETCGFFSLPTGRSNSGPDVPIDQLLLNNDGTLKLEAWHTTSAIVTIVEANGTRADAGVMPIGMCTTFDDIRVWAAKSLGVGGGGKSKGGANFAAFGVCKIEMERTQSGQTKTKVLTGLFEVVGRDFADPPNLTNAQHFCSADAAVFAALAGIYVPFPSVVHQRTPSSIEAAFSRGQVCNLDDAPQVRGFFWSTRNAEDELLGIVRSKIVAEGVNESVRDAALKVLLEHGRFSDGIGFFMSNTAQMFNLPPDVIRQKQTSLGGLFTFVATQKDLWSSKLWQSIIEAVDAKCVLIGYRWKEAKYNEASVKRFAELFVKVSAFWTAVHQAAAAPAAH